MAASAGIMGILEAMEVSMEMLYISTKRQDNSLIRACSNSKPASNMSGWLQSWTASGAHQHSVKLLAMSRLNCAQVTANSQLQVLHVCESVCCLAEADITGHRSLR